MIYTNEIIKKKKRREKRRKTIINTICITIFVLILLLICYKTYLRCIKKQDDVSIFGFRQYIIMTGSMEPKYNIGDLIVIKEKKKEDIKVNDIITYVVGIENETITHRIVDIIEKDGQTMYRTKGDNNNKEDLELVSYDQIKGVLVFKISKLGKIITKMFTIYGIAIILLIIFIAYFHSSRNEEKRIAREDARKRYNIPKYEKEDVS